MIYLVGTLFFILLQAFFSGIETGLVSLQKPRVRHGVKKELRAAKILDFFIRRPGQMLSTTLIGTNICVVCASLMAKKTAESFGFGDNSGIFTASVILAVILLAAEIIPKDWFRQSPYTRCMIFSGMLYFFYMLLYYPVKFMAAFTDLIIKKMGSSKNRKDPGVLLREDFRLLLRDSEREGVIDSEAADILDRAVDFYKITVRDIMVPNERTVAVNSGATVTEAVGICRRNTVSRIPVYLRSSRPGNAVRYLGIFSIYDAIFTVPEEKWNETAVGTLLRPAVTVCADRGCEDVLRAAKLTKSNLMIVSEPGNPDVHIGIVSPLDVVQSLFG